MAEPFVDTAAIMERAEKAQDRRNFAQAIPGLAILSAAAALVTAPIVVATVKPSILPVCKGEATNPVSRLAYNIERGFKKPSCDLR
ncbi:MAG: hypothetical protein WAO98_10425 [Alphaproteobacteria bacterium]